MPKHTPKRGRPRAAPDRVVTYIRLPADVRAAVETRARAHCRTLSGEVEAVLRAALGMVAA